MTPYRRFTARFRHVLVLGLVLLTGSPALAVDYTFSDLGTITGPLAGTGAVTWGISNSGHVVGGNTSAYQWTGGTPTPLGTLPGAVGSFAYGVNDAGHSAGTVYLDPAVDASIPVRWDGTTAVPLQVLGGGTQEFGAEAFSINNHDQLVGQMWGGTSIRPVIWNGTTVTDLGTLGGSVGTANFINDLGQAVGQSNTTNDDASHATLWSQGSIIDLGALADGDQSFANTLNEQGQIVGFNTSADLETTRAVLWQNNIITELPGLGGSSSFANDINEQGTIAGISSLSGDPTLRAVVWHNGQIIDLNQFLPSELAAQGWLLSYGIGINDAGVIVGYAINPSSDQSAGFQLTPVPVPAAVWLFGSGVVTLAAMVRKRLGVS